MSANTTKPGKVGVGSRLHSEGQTTAAVAVGAPEDVAIVSAGVAEGSLALLAPPDTSPAPEPLAAAAEDRAGSIEITLPDGARVSVDAFVNEKALRACCGPCRCSRDQLGAWHEGVSRLPPDRFAQRV